MFDPGRRAAQRPAILSRFEVGMDYAVGRPLYCADSCAVNSLRQQDSHPINLSLFQEASEAVVQALREVVVAILRRNYITANDVYLRLAIGNAAWPIGVTNVGIHSRTGRERIFSQNIAHVLNDETQRKYIQVRGHLPFLAKS